MAGRNNKQKGAGRDPGGFMAIPWLVVDSPAYSRLGHPSKALLLEIARQFVRNNNGRLLCSRAYLEPRGWRSSDVIDRAKKELIEAGFLFETVKGHRPNKASWYAITWQTLDRHPDYDPGAMEGFERGAYRNAPPPKNASLCPSGGTRRAPIAPPDGTGRARPAPSPGTIQQQFAPTPAPSPGHLLDKPSAAAKRPTQQLSNCI